MKAQAADAVCAAESALRVEEAILGMALHVCIALGGVSGKVSAIFG
jgi:hypothetical protein